MSKTKKIVSKINTKTTRKIARDVTTNGISEGIFNGLQEKANGKSFKKGFSKGVKDGMVNGAVTSITGLKIEQPFINNLVGGTISNLWKEGKQGQISGDKAGRVVVNTVSQTVVGGAFGVMGNEINIDGLWESKSLANIMGAGTFEYFGQAINASYSMAGNAAIDVFFKED